MEFGKIEYICRENGSGAVTLRLTLIGQKDDEILRRSGIAALRQKRIVRLAQEAEQQGCLLSYDDLQVLLLTSLSTVKRDVSQLETKGLRVPLKSRKKKCEGATPKDDYTFALMTEGM